MLSNPREEPKRKRRRTCADEARRALLERQRQRRGGDPAGKVALQLLALLSVVLALRPPVPLPGFSFLGRSRKMKPTYSGDDLGPTAYAMERGIDPAFYETDSPRRKPRASWTRLIRDLKRPRAAAKARAEIEARVPPGAHEWLREAIDAGEHWQLHKIGPPGASDADIAVAALGASDAWKAAIAAEAAAAVASRKTPGGGDSGVPGGPKP
ncbi:hypothetical protein PH547_11065 [Rhizobium sp. CNPSo 3464]|uniref:hypothetical protein n=1 Tax=Rhizobium sp. CNPSo 3464 TaxID=3021406 RepID=UPI00254B1B9C|nr:hypothetical protein [Rhizobium sp. CNPSo 3464]MDK4739413.1 hypothetical protein [Rhizobium sp. CNPSo 3464]